LSLSLLAGDVVQINTSVDKQSLPINDTLTLTLSLDGSQNLPGFSLPAMTDFVVLGQSSSTQIQIINGQQTSSKSFIFTLRPQRQGTARIPVFQFELQGNTFRTQPIAVTVTGYVTPNASAQGGGGRRSFMDDFFGEDFFASRFGGRQQAMQRSVPAQQVIVEYTPQKYTLYRGEKTMLDLRLLFERGFQQGPAFNFPVLDGFVAEPNPKELKDLKVQTVTRSGKNFQMLNFSKAIYASSAGTKSIPAVQVQYVDNPFEGVKTQSSPLASVRIIDLPQPQPENFSGAVGSFGIALKFAPKPGTRTNEAIPLEVTVTGRGNADMVNALKLPEGDGVTWYLDSMNNAGSSSLQVQKKFTYFLTPGQSGTIQLPKIEFCYFDPGAGAYRTAEASLPEFSVEQGSGQSALSPSTTAASGIQLQQGAVEIRLDKNVLHSLKQNALEILKWLAGVLAITAIVFLFIRWRSAPVIRLKKQYSGLKQHNKADDQAFARELQTFLTALAKVKYKFNLAGATQVMIRAKIKEEEKADAMVTLVAKYEELNYTKATLSAEDKQAMLGLAGKLL
jgi:hypothetical protein